jgi:sec-independent protein translocase protein TatC
MRFRVRRLEHDEEVSVVEHLDELRNRLIVSTLCILVAFGVAFWRHQDIYRLLINAGPKKINGHAYHFTVFQVGEQFKIALSVSFWAAVLVAFPVLFYQLYAYVVPAFDPQRRRTSWPLLVMVPALFVAGALFSYFVVIPAASGFLFGFDSNVFTVLPQAQPWFQFCITMMLMMGVVFEMPALVLLLTRLGIITSRTLRRYRRHAIVVNAVVAAALPGVDPVSMALELLPLLALYEGSILLARIAEPRAASTHAVTEP